MGARWGRLERGFTCSARNRRREWLQLLYGRMAITA